MATIPPNDIGSADALDTTQHFFVNQSGLLKQDTLGSLLALIQSNILVPVANGGTGATTAAEALAALLPAQSDEAGKMLGTDGGTAYWMPLSTVLPIALFSGAGSPEGDVAAQVGSLYMNQGGGAGTVLYVKESGSDEYGWVAK